MILLHSLARMYGGDPASYFEPDLPPLGRFAVNVAAIQAGAEEERRAQEEARSEAKAAQAAQQWLRNQRVR